MHVRLLHNHQWSEKEITYTGHPISVHFAR